MHIHYSNWFSAVLKLEIDLIMNRVDMIIFLQEDGFLYVEDILFMLF